MFDSDFIVNRILSKHPDDLSDPSKAGFMESANWPTTIQMSLFWESHLFHESLISSASCKNIRARNYEKSFSAFLEKILRFCVVLNSTVVGGMSKLLKFAIAELKPKKIISFCDEMHFDGTVYEKLNFVKITTGKPAALYFSSNGILRHRFSFQKMLNLESSELTERQLAQQLKLNRVWDCGSSKWELDVVPE
jgi:hypothetical protein